MQPERSTAEKAAAFWDANREKAKDPAFWMAHPLCRQAINRRITGSPHEWPLDWFKRVYGGRPFARGVSWGCGLGAFERAAVKIGLVREIDAFDISPASLEDARRAAEEEGIAGIHYRVGNFDDPRLEKSAYDIVFFHQSLHHVSRLERLFRALTSALVPGGAVSVDEYVGPSRHEWRQEHLKKAQEVLDRLPAEAKLRGELALPIEQNDPSEAVRSGEITRFLRGGFDLLEWKPYGGQIVDLVFPCITLEWAMSGEGVQYVEEMLALEDREIAEDPSRSHHLVAYGRLKAPSERKRLRSFSLGSWLRRFA